MIGQVPTRVCQTRYSVGPSTSAVRWPPASSRAAGQPGRPALAVLGEHHQPGPHVLGPLGVVGRQRGHRRRPAGDQRLAPVVELVGRDRQVVGVPAHLVGAGEAEPAVVGGVLDALGHDRPAGLLEPHPEVVGERPRCRAAPAAGRGPSTSATTTSSASWSLGASSPRARSAAALDDRRLLGIHPRPRHDVGPVAVHGDEQRLERAAHGGLVDVAEDRGARAASAGRPPRPARRRRPAASPRRPRRRARPGRARHPPTAGPGRRPRPRR